jgi:hypothetical protein
MPLLDPASALPLADPQFSLSDFMRQPVALGEVTLAPEAGSPDTRAALRSWLMRLFRDTHRISRAVTARKEAVVAENDKEKELAKEKAAQSG